MAIPLRRLRFENPVLTKELRTRMRGARAYGILFVYLLVLSLILFFTYLSWWNSRRWNGDDAAFAVGRMFYVVLFSTQAVLVGLITPALTAGAVSMEREQRTYELLSASLLPRRAIVVGKLLAAVLFVGLLLTSSLPLVSLCFLLGGVSPAEVCAAYGLLLVVAVLYGAVGVACSAIAKSTSTATVSAYGIILLLFFATLPLALMNAGQPFGVAGFGIGLGAVNPVGSVLGGILSERYFGLTLPAWLPALLVNGLLAIILVVVAVHRLVQPQGDRSALLRVLTAAFVGMMAFFVYGALLPGNAQGMLQFAQVGERMTILAVVSVLAPCLLVSIFVTADGLPAGGVFSGLDPRRLRRGEAPSGLLYVLLLVGLCVLVLFIGAPHDLRPSIRSLAVLMFTLTLCLGGVGLLTSALLENRWSAFSLTLALVTLLCLVPLTRLMSYERGQRGSAWDNTLYLSPIPAAIELGSPRDAGDFRRSIPPLWGGRTPFQAVTPIVYGALGAGCLLAAQAAHGRRRRRDAAVGSVPVATT